MQPLTPEACYRYGRLLRSEARLALDRVSPYLCFPLSQLYGGPVRVAHIGCGNGQVTNMMLAPRYPETVQIVGSDPNPAMLQHAQDSLLYHPKLGLMYTSEEMLSCLRPYSHILSFNYIKTLDTDSVNRLYELLAPGGIAVLVVLMSPLYAIYKLLAGTKVYKQYMTDLENHVPLYQTMESYICPIGLMSVKGLCVMGHHFDETYYSFDSEEELTGYLTAIDPFVARMPEKDRRSYMGNLLGLCRGMRGVTVLQDTGHHFFNFSRLTLVVRRVS